MSEAVDVPESGDTEAAALGGAALSVRGLRVGVVNGPAIVEDIDLDVGAGEILGIVGESGSGKTTLGLALLGYSGPGVEIQAGRLEIGGAPVAMDESMRSIRGVAISYVPQDPGQALNPSLRLQGAVTDILGERPRKRAGESVSALFETVNLPASAEFLRRYPHQLSGGQRQRVVIGMAISRQPGVVVFDEPTTGLDVETQKRILDELRRLRDSQGISMIYISHDLAVVAELADRIAVMYSGRVVESGTASTVLTRPRHPYTRGLLASIPDHLNPRVLEPMRGTAVGIGQRPRGCSFAPRCPLKTDECTVQVPPLVEVFPGHRAACIHWQATPPVSVREPVLAAVGPDSEALLVVEHLRAEHSSRASTVVAAADVSLTLARGRCIALVGESGSGKTTIARAIVGLHPASAGRIALKGEALNSEVRKRRIEQRQALQLIAQNPRDALNPRHTIDQSIIRPIRLFRSELRSRSEVDREIAALLDRVRLPLSLADRYPHELSGGEIQRVAIARALAARPEVLVCDEITSALDVSVQAAVLTLLESLQADFGLSLLFITHNLGVVATIADEVLVLEKGVVCEEGTTSSLLRDPQHPYTKRLLDAAPSLVEATGAA